MPGPIAALGLQLGAQAASGTISGIQGALFGKGADRRQYQLQEKLQRLGIYGAKEMSDYNYAKELQMWKDTNYKAQVEELEKAGLNPGLLYGMSGGGGTTTGTPNTGVPQGAAGRGAAEVQGMGINYAQMGLLQAQKENIEADTALKQATVPKTQAETSSITQGVENQKAQQKLIELEQKAKQIDINFATDSYQNRLSMVNLEVSKINEEINLLSKENLLAGKQLEDKVTLLKQQIALTIAEKYLKYAETANVQQDTKNKVRELINMIEKNMREWDTLGNQRERQSFEQVQEYMNESEFPRELRDVLDNIIIIPGMGKGGYKPVTGFHQKNK